MAEKNVEIFDLGPVEQFDVQDSGMVLYNGTPLDYKELERIARTARNQGAGILAVQEKTKVAIRTIGEITVSGVFTVDDTYGKLMKIRDRHRKGSEHYLVVASFIERVTQEFGQATIQAMRIGQKWVLQVLYTSPFPPPEAKRRQKLSWLGKLLVSNNDENED
jgi:hypothetical protein